MDYSIYKLNKREILKYTLIYMVLSTAIAYAFYDSAAAFLVMLPLGVLYFKRVRKVLAGKRKDKLRRQFQDMIDSVSSSLSAGYSVENSFYEARKDMRRLYGKDSLITAELDYFFSLLDTGTTPESILSDFGNRADVEDISDFAEIFVLAKRNGGDFNDIIGKTVKVMKEKDETEREIAVILTGRRYEQRLMCVIPFAIILYLRISSSDFLSVLYHNIFGVTVMTLCLVIYGLSYGMSERITDIRV
ncbi:MAG: pilus assembly protein TadB [Lachnospiraceae bacterium]|nr:pilus assembly protein TadB [Lachnospiraceae bacterium]